MFVVILFPGQTDPSQDQHTASHSCASCSKPYINRTHHAISTLCKVGKAPWHVGTVTAAARGLQAVLDMLAVCNNLPHAGDTLLSALRFDSRAVAPRTRDAGNTLSYGACQVGDTSRLQLKFRQKGEEPSESKTSCGLGKGWKETTSATACPWPL